jgi:hypothetical protein
MNWRWLTPFVIAFYFIRRGLHFFGWHWRYNFNPKIGPQNGDGACRLCDDGWEPYR